MTQNHIEIIKLIIAGISSIGGYQLFISFIRKYWKRIKKKTPADLFDDYNRQLKTYIETHTETLSKLNEALDEVSELKSLLRQRDSKLNELTLEISQLNIKLKEKEDIIAKVKQSQEASNELLKQLQVIVNELSCGNVPTCENHKPIKIN